MVFLSPGYSYSKAQQNIFDVYILGLKLGRLNYAVELKDNLYSAAGNLRSTCIFSVGSKYKFEASNYYVYALNQVTINRKNTTSMLSIDTKLNDQYLTTYWSD